MLVVVSGNIPNSSLNIFLQAIIYLSVKLELKFQSSQPYMCIQNGECYLSKVSLLHA